MAIKIEMLRCFVAVAECGNLADAAERLARSPSAVSMMLKQLEEHLGQTLFETDRKNRLSRTGAFVLERARPELRQFAHTVQAMERFARSGVDTLRVAAVPSVAGTVLPVALTRFLDAWPDVRVDLRDMDSMSVLQALRGERIDLGIATAAPDTGFTRRLPLFSDAFGVVCPADHPLARGTEPLGWEALADEALIGNELCRTISSAAFAEIHRRARLAVHNTGSLLAMVKAGLGVTVLPRMVVRLDAAGITFRALADTRARRRIELLRRSDAALSPAAEAFGTHVADAVRALASEASGIVTV